MWGGDDFSVLYFIMSWSYKIGIFALLGVLRLEGAALVPEGKAGQQSCYVGKEYLAFW